MAIVYNTSVVRNGLVFYVDAGNIKSYPGSGTTWSDLSGNNLHMTMQGSPTWNSGGYFTNWSNSNYFDRTNSDVWSYVPLGDTPRTALALVEMGTVSGYQHVFHYGNGGSTNQTYGIAAYLGNLSDHRWGTSNIGTNTLVAGTRYFLSVRHSAVYTGARLGVNTSYQDVTTITTAATASGQFRIGIRTSTLTEAWPSDGRIYAVMLYNRALSDDEILQNFEAMRGRVSI